MKFAQVGYGSEGQGVKKDGTGYIYLVEDTVRKGSKITPIVTHYRSGKLFVTTGMIVENPRKTEPTIDGQNATEYLDEKGKEIKRTYTQRQLGAKPERDVSGRYAGGGESIRIDGNYIVGSTELRARAMSIGVYSAEHKGITDKSFSSGEATTQAMGKLDEITSKGKI